MQSNGRQQTEQASRTSIMVAAGRAFGALEPDPAARNPDFLAARLLTAQELDQIEEHPIAAALRKDPAAGYETNRHIIDVAILANLMTMRTRYIDEQLARAVADGATQIVILGAGFDTRGYRLKEIFAAHAVDPGTMPVVYEVDAPATQRHKRQRVAELFDPVPGHLRFVPVDFNRQDLATELARAGYDSGRLAFFICEGVSMYVPENNMKQTLISIASNAAPGSRVVVEYVSATLVRLMQQYEDLPASKFTSKWGEPWVFGIADGRETAFFQECGFSVDELFSLMSPAAQKRYLTRSDGTLLRPDRKKARRISEAAGYETYSGFKFLLRMLLLIVLLKLKGGRGHGLALLRVA